MTQIKVRVDSTVGPGQVTGKRSGIHITELDLNLEEIISVYLINHGDKYFPGSALSTEITEVEGAVEKFDAPIIDAAKELLNNTVPFDERGYCVHCGYSGHILSCAWVKLENKINDFEELEKG